MTSYYLVDPYTMEMILDQKKLVVILLPKLKIGHCRDNCKQHIWLRSH